MDKFYDDILLLEQNLFTKNLLLKFLEKYQCAQVIERVLSETDQALLQRGINLLSKIIAQPDLYVKILFPSTQAEESLVIQLVMSDEDQLRKLISQALDMHSMAVLEQLNRLATEQDVRLHNYIQILLMLLCDPESQIGLQVLRSLEKMIKQKKHPLSFFGHNAWLDECSPMLKQAEEIARLRILDVLIMLSNQSADIHKTIAETGILEPIVSLYQTDDVLVKMSAVEVFSKIGESSWNCDFISQHQIMASVIKDAFNEKEDLFLRKYLGILISKLVGNFSIKFTPELQKKMSSLIRELASSKSNEEIWSSFEIIGHLSKVQQGIDCIVSDAKMFQEYVSYSANPNSIHKSKFFSSFVNFFREISLQKKNTKILSNVFVSLVCPNLVAEKPFASEFADQTLLEKATDFVMSLIVQPFEELEQELLLLWTSLTELPLIIKMFMIHPGTIDYLTKSIAQNKILFDLKFELIEKLIKLCETQLTEGEFKAFAQAVKKALSSNIKTQSQDELTYETVTQ